MGYMSGDKWVQSWDDYDRVMCGCCGKMIPDTPEGNADHETRGQEVGHGMCRKCEDWSFDLVMGPIFAKVRESLNGANQKKWDGLGDGAKAHFVEKMPDKGVIKWKIG